MPDLTVFSQIGQAEPIAAFSTLRHLFPPDEIDNLAGAFRADSVLTGDMFGMFLLRVMLREHGLDFNDGLITQIIAMLPQELRKFEIFRSPLVVKAPDKLPKPAVRKGTIPLCAVDLRNINRDHPKRAFDQLLSVFEELGAESINFDQFYKAAYRGVTETLNNAAEHASANSCVLAAENRDNILTIAVANRQATIRSRLTEDLKACLATDEEALFFAIFPGFTKTTDSGISAIRNGKVERGLGLFYLLEMGWFAGGFVICSGESALSVSNNVLAPRVEASFFTGTAIGVSIDMSEFEASFDSFLDLLRLIATEYLEKKTIDSPLLDLPALRSLFNGGNGEHWLPRLLEDFFRFQSKRMRSYAELKIDYIDHRLTKAAEYYAFLDEENRARRAAKIIHPPFKALPTGPQGVWLIFPGDNTARLGSVIAEGSHGELLVYRSATGEEYIGAFKEDDADSEGRKIVIVPTPLS